jgi:hypothetical protein
MRIAGPDARYVIAHRVAIEVVDADDVLQGDGDRLVEATGIGGAEQAGSKAKESFLCAPYQTSTRYRCPGNMER